jgi:hypothetical protein
MDQRYQLRYYILDADGNVQTTTDMDLWANWYFKIENRRVALTDLGDKGKVYTTFVSIMGMPLVFGLGPEWETMHFSVDDEPGQRWSWYSLETAKIGHETIVELIKNGGIE